MKYVVFSSMYSDDCAKQLCPTSESLYQAYLMALSAGCPILIPIFAIFCALE